MTLAELLPSVGGELCARVDTTTWPRSTEAGPGGAVTVGGVGMAGLAARFGTPAYVLDQAEVVARAREFGAVLPEAEIAYAGKALLCKGVLRWLRDEGCSLDVSSAGELAVAREVGLPGDRILLHGNAKTPEDLKAAVDWPGVRVVIDSLDEIGQLAALARRSQPVLLRIIPGIDAGTHPKITTGTEDGKFGFAMSTGDALAAVERTLRQPNLDLVGLHCHLGSQIFTVDSYEAAVRTMAGFLATVRDRFGVTIPALDIGGGFGVPYLPGQPEFDLNGFANRVRVALNFECGRLGLPVPKLIIEPGRAIVARAGVTLYRVVNIKRGRRNFVAVDGGMSDNPRPALYGAEYAAYLIGRKAPRHMITAAVVGRHCESGDVLCPSVPLPADVHAGDILAVPCTGAYHHPLASNYNLVGRPPIVGVRDGLATLLVRREVEEDLLARDVG